MDGVFEDGRFPQGKGRKPQAVAESHTTMSRGRGAEIGRLWDTPAPFPLFSMSGLSLTPDDDFMSEPPSAEARREVEALATLLGTPSDLESNPDQPLEAKPEPDDSH